MTLTITLTDLLVLTCIICLIMFTIYVVLVLKALIVFINQSTEFMTESTTLANEGTKVVTTVQEKSKAVESFVSEAFINGQGIFKGLSILNKLIK